MERFVEAYHDEIAGVLSGFDRVLFRGTLRSISHPEGAAIWLNGRGVLLKEFAGYVQHLTDQLTSHARELAATAQRPFEYLTSSRQSKEDRVRAIQQRDGITEGLICILSAVEPCRAITVRGDRTTRRLQVRTEDRKCAHLYFYYADREFGVFHIRLQTWLPFTLQVCLNGRDWLAQQLTRARIPFTRVDNCITTVGDTAAAQRLLDQLATRRWAKVLRHVAERVNPLVRRRANLSLRSYYWSLQESEFATDVLFRDPADLRRLYPHWTRHAIDRFRSTDVLRFLGRRLGGRSDGEVTSSYLRRPEGLRVKHRVEENSLKMYDKAGCVLRVETTINQPRRFLVYRERTRHGRRRRCWGKMRKGIADIARRVALSRAANARYLDALTGPPPGLPVEALFDPSSQRRRVHGRPFRALRPIAPDDSACFALFLDGRFALQGLRARDLRRHLAPSEPHAPAAQRALTGRVSRLLRLYRAHGLLEKVAHSHLYRVTPKGHHLMSAALRIRATPLDQLAA